jgi:hypothetical protein
MRVQIYSWYGNANVVAPYKHGEIVEGDPWVLAKTFFNRDKTIALRKPKDTLKCDILLMVSDSGFGQR